MFTLPIPKLIVTSVQSRRFKNALLLPNPNKMRLAADLHNTYSEVVREWNDSEDAQSLYEFAEPRTRELLLGTEEDAETIHDFDIASMYAHTGNWKRASQYLGYVLRKTSQKIEKLGYGYDTSGEVQRGGGTSGEGRHLWDTGNSPKHDHTQNNPMNMMYDADAEADYPELAEFKHHRVYWPPRTR